MSGTAAAEVDWPKILELMPGLAMTVDGESRLVSANSALLMEAELSPEDARGLKPGEILNCVHSQDYGTGCGSTPHCRLCGMTRAIVEAFRTGERSVKECSLLAGNRGKEEAYDLRITATPIGEGIGRLIVLGIEDLSGTKRKEVLERLFYHDIMNSMISIRSLAQLIRTDAGDPEALEEYLERMVVASENLIEEVRQQKGLFDMERDELKPTPFRFDAAEAVEETVWLLERALESRGLVSIAAPKEGCPMTSDEALFKRVMRNALKNAMEASKKGDKVELEIEPRGERTLIAVKNPAYIEPEDQLRVFHRSFSTKGRGRGLGTYSMRLIVKTYLGGDIAFSSKPESGTTFLFDLPSTLEA